MRPNVYIYTDTNRKKWVYIKKCKKVQTYSSNYINDKLKKKKFDSFKKYDDYIQYNNERYDRI